MSVTDELLGGGITLGGIPEKDKERKNERMSE